MPRHGKLAAKVLLVTLAFAAFVLTGSLSAAEGPGAVVEMSSSLSGGVTTYSITLVNNSSTAIGDIFIAGRVPEGGAFQAASATPAGAWFRGVEGGAAVWLSNGVPARSKQGPFSFTVKNASGKIAASNAWVHYRLPQDTVLSSPDIERSEISVAKVGSVNAADKTLFPPGTFALTTSAGPGQKDSDKMVTSGLTKVPVGTWVNLASRSQGEGDKTLTAWSWTIEGPGGGVQIEGGNTKSPRFFADRVGKYVASVLSTDVDGKRTASSVDITAGRYVGGDWCAACHNGSVMPDIVSKWQETGHATKFVETYPRYSATSDYCVRCHTVGYDETDKAGGFDDAVQLAGYDLSKGSFLKQVKDAGKTIDQIMANPQIARFANIQCENCHGPGGNAHTGAKSYETGVCNQCHSQNAQWKNSKHATEPPLHMAEGASCVECHTSQGFVAVKIRGKDAVFPDQATETKQATIPDPGAMSALGCVTCHDPHQATYPVKEANGHVRSLQLRIQGEVTMPNGVTVDAEVSAVCVSCHANKRDLAYKADFLAGNKTRGVHDNSQSDIFYGAGAVDYGKTFASSAHKTVATEGCVTCHMAPTPGGKTDPAAPGNNKIGGHTFAVASDGVENVANACGSCHAGLTTLNRPARGDFDGNGKVEGVQDEVKGLLAVLAAKLPKDSKGEVLSSFTATNTTEAQRKALWNYFLVKNDGSLGVHNTKYAVGVLQETYLQLTGSTVPNASAP